MLGVPFIWENYLNKNAVRLHHFRFCKKWKNVIAKRNNNVQLGDIFLNEINYKLEYELISSDSCSNILLSFLCLRDNKK